MNVCRMIGVLALGLIVCSCAGKQQSTETTPKKQEVANVSRIEGASIETLKNEPRVSAAYENIVLTPPQTTSQLSTDYPDVASQLQTSALAYLKDKKMYTRVEGGLLKGASPKNTLIADTKIIDMRIVSEGARMWGGVMAGSSYIEVYLKLTDASSKKVIHEKVIATNYNAFASTYASGSEKSLAMDMGKIIGEYLSVVVPRKGKNGTGAKTQVKKQPKKRTR